MKSRVKWMLVAGVAAGGACAYIALNTRLGVHLVLDVLSEIGSPKERQTEASEGPLRLTATLAPIDKIQLPASIEQPSGIKHRNEAVYISTDQTEIFKLDANFQNGSERVYLLGGPLLFKQGSLEGIEVRGDQLVGIGEFGSLPTWVEGGQAEWTRGADIELPSQTADVEFSGVVDTPSGRFATSEDQLAIFNLDDGSVHAIDFAGVLRESADPSVLALSGIAHSTGRFYVLSESYTSVLVVDAATFKVQHVFGIEPCAAADLSVYEGKCYVVIDHNYDEPVEPVHVYDLEAAVKAAEEDGQNA
ncbi:MAG: hypothetical protein AAGI53_10460 [Planctomycetota bacterium]